MNVWIVWITAPNGPRHLSEVFSTEEEARKYASFDWLPSVTVEVTSQRVHHSASYEI